jgi:transcriptional regulator with XRE-family HTH domain
VNIGKRLRRLREAKDLSQGAIEKSSGLLRTYVSRVEHGCIVPKLDTLERWAKVLDVPLWEVFADTEIPSEQAQVEPSTPYEKKLFGLLERVDKADRAFFIFAANKLA